MLDSMYVKMSTSTGLYPNLDLWNANKLHYISLQRGCHTLSSAHLIIELLRNEVSIRAESTGKQCDSGIVKKTNIECDPTEKLHVKTKWSDIVAGGSIGRRKEDDIKSNF